MTTSYVVAAIVLFAGHCLYVTAVRYARLHDLTARYGNKYSYSLEQKKCTGKLRMIDSYTGVRDAQRIVRLSSLFDFPFIFGKALEFGLFKTYGVPTISSLLLRTGQFSKAENAARRYVDTAGLIQAYMLYPLPKFDYEDDDAAENPDSWECIGDDAQDPRSAIALARVNFLHSRWSSKISNDDLLFTLAVFVLEPVAWIERYEWRSLSRLESEALFAMMYHVGRCMGIQNIPESLEELDAWTKDYDRRATTYTPTNAAVAKHTFDLLLYGLPASVQAFGLKFAASFMDEHLRRAFDIDKPPRPIVVFKDALMRTRALLTRYVFLPRIKPLSNLPLGCEAGKGEFSVERALNVSLGVCPASNALAAEGKSCPVGAHQNGPTETARRDLVWRMEQKWYENEPIYSRPYAQGRPAWLLELVKVKLGLLPAEHRRGTSKWRASTLPQHPAGPVQGLGGFRLEELGPKGLEMKGREQVMQNAAQLNARPLEGRWAFIA